MVDQTERGGSNNMLYFIVGGLVVAAGVLGFLYFNGYVGGARDVNVTVEQPAAPATTAPAPAPATGTTTQ